MLDAKLAVARQGQWYFFQTAELIGYEQAIKGRMTWDELEEAQAIAELLAMEAAGNA